MVNYDDDDFAEFMSRVNDVSATIEGLQSGAVDANAMVAADEARLREENAIKAKRERRTEEASLKVEARVAEADRMQRLREEKKDELEVRPRGTTELAHATRPPTIPATPSCPTRAGAQEGLLPTQSEARAVGGIS